MNLSKTVYNKKWLEEHKEKISSLFPDTFTHIRNLNMLIVGFNLKLLGIDFRTDEELAECFAAFESNDIISRDAQLIKRK